MLTIADFFLARTSDILPPLAEFNTASIAQIKSISIHGCLYFTGNITKQKWCRLFALWRCSSHEIASFAFDRIGNKPIIGCSGLREVESPKGSKGTLALLEMSLDISSSGSRDELQVAEVL